MSQVLSCRCSWHQSCPLCFFSTLCPIAIHVYAYISNYMQISIEFYLKFTIIELLIYLENISQRTGSPFLSEMRLHFFILLLLVFFKQLLINCEAQNCNDENETCENKCFGKYYTIGKWDQLGFCMEICFLDFNYCYFRWLHVIPLNPSMCKISNLFEIASGPIVI